MGDILGLGLTHDPPLIGRDEDMADILRLIRADPGLPEHLCDPAGWPAAMGQEPGASAAKAHADVVVDAGEEVALPP